MRDTIRIEAAAVAAQVANLLTACPDLADDGQLLLDMIEAETDMFEVGSKLVRLRQERRATAEGLSSYMDDLSERKARLLRGADGIASMLKSLMGIAGIDKLMLPEATVSVTRGRESVVITDPDAVPSQLCKTIRQPDKDAIGKALKAGETIPGAALVAGETGITVRTK